MTTAAKLARLVPIARWSDCGRFLVARLILDQIDRTHPVEDSGRFVIRGREV